MGLSITLLLIGVAVLIFSYWGFRLIRKHIKRFNNGQKFSTSLNDEKYFELKARQDYIIASSTLIFAVLSFIGYSSIKDIKTDLNNQVLAERQKIDTLKNTADETDKTFINLQITGKTLKDSMISALEIVQVLKNKVGQILAKDVIKQNLYIIDNLKMGDFPATSEKNFENNKIVYFKNLTSISGQKLPEFIKPPTVLAMSINGGSVAIRKISKDGFQIATLMGLPMSEEESKVAENVNGDNVRFSVWISEK
jgi:hypothetical protein